MLAATYRRYGPPSVLSVSEVPTPSAGRGEVLIRVRASTVSSGDVRVRGLDVPSPVFLPMVRLVFGVRRPRNPIPGAELSGVIEAVGEGVDEWKVGDAVVASTSAKGRANAPFVAFPAGGVIVRKPERLSFEQAACLPFGGLTAHYFLRKGGLRAGQRVLIHGASGSVGTHAVQLARHVGAHVTAVCSAKNHELVRALGADEVVDYRATPLESLRVERGYDILFETVGKVGFAATRHLLAEDGRFLAAVMTMTEMRQMLTTRVGRQRVIGGVVVEKRADLQHLADLAEGGHLTPPIDRVYPLDQIAAAHAHAETGHKVGHVVIAMPG